MLANGQQQNENPESFPYLSLDMDLDLDLIIFNLFMFYHLQSAFLCITFKTILPDGLRHGVPAVPPHGCWIWG